MNGLHWRCWDPFRELQREMGRLFESIDPFQSVRPAHRYPPLNLYDAGDRYMLSAQLPGMTPADIDLSITGETLTIRGEAQVSRKRERRELPTAGATNGSLGAYDHVAGPRG